MNRGIITNFRSKIKPENRKYISKNLEISQQVSAYLDLKGWTQKDFARKLGKSEPEVSKLLSGLHNLTLKSITNMEFVLGDDIIVTPMKAREKYKKVEYVTFMVYKNEQQQTNRNSYNEVTVEEPLTESIAS